MGEIIRNGESYSGSGRGGVTGVKGSNETEYRDGNVSIDADDIGAVATDYVLSGSPVVSDYIYPPLNVGIMHIATLTIDNGRKKGLNSPIVIELSISGFQKSHTLYIQFDYRGTGTNLLHSFTYSGPKADNRFYIRNTNIGADEWNLFVSMEGSPLNGDGCVSVLRFSNPNNDHASGAVNIQRVYCSGMFLENLPAGTDYEFEWAGENYMKKDEDNLVTANIQLSPPDLGEGGYNTPVLEWKDSKRTVWSGIKNNSGSFYLWDSTNNRSIITSGADGRGNTYGGSKALITTDGEGGNLRLFSPNGNVGTEIDCYNNSIARWYISNPIQNTIPATFSMDVEGSAGIVALKNIDLKVGVNYAVLITTQANTYGEIKAAEFTTVSSRRYKENVLPMTGERAKTILNVDVVTFDYKDGVVGKNPLDRSGVIAEDVLEVAPEVVSYAVVDDEEIPDSVDYSKFVPYLIKMIQIQQDEIDQLKAQNAVLSDRLEAIEKRGMTGKMDGTA